MLGGDFLKCIRKLRGFTQEEVSEQFGCDIRTYRRWEKNQTPVPFDSVKIIITDIFQLDFDKALELSTYANDKRSTVRA